MLVVLAFLPALMADFVDWDDDDLLFKATYYRTLNAQSLRWMFTTNHAGHFHPLTWLSYSLDWAIWGRNAFGYHLSSVLIHATSALVVFFLTRVLIRTATVETGEPTGKLPGTAYNNRLTACAALAAALFAIHPLRVESVAWIAERRDVLSGLFYLSAVASYVRFATSPNGRRGARWFIASLSLQGLSLLSKASAATLPAVLLILDVYPLRRTRGIGRPEGNNIAKLVLEKIPFVILAGLGAWRAIIAQSASGAMYPLAEYDLVSRFAQACYGIGFYIGKTVWPFDLGPLYQLPSRDVLLGPMLYASVVFVILLAFVALGARRRAPGVTAAVLIYAVILSPVLGFFQSGPQLVADRYSYLSCVGFSMLLPASIFVWSGRSHVHSRRPPALFVTGAALVTLLFHATATQSKIWSSSVSLWARGVEVSPDSSIAHANLADVLSAIGDLPTAAWHYQRSLELQPIDAITTHHFANVLVRLGDLGRARILYEQTLRLDPNRTGVHFRLAGLLVASGETQAAADLLRQRLRASPTDVETGELLCRVLAMHSDLFAQGAAEACTIANDIVLANGASHAPSLLLQASALARSGRLDDAMTVSLRALNLANEKGDTSLISESHRRIAIIEGLRSPRIDQE